MVKNLPSNAGNMGSIPGQGTKVPRAEGQLSPRVATRESQHTRRNEDPAQQKRKHSVNRKRKKESEVALLCPTLCNPMDCSLPGSSIHGILQARILEWAAISFSRASSQPRDQILVSLIAGRRFTL